MDNRNQEMNIVKSLGIIAVVLGHTAFEYGNILYMYHMALFFFVSGYFINDSMLHNPINWLIRRIKNYYVPYITFSIIFIFFRNLMVNIKIYEESWRITNIEMFKVVKERIFFMSGEPLLGTFWFFRSILYVSILFLIINLLLKKLDILNERNLVFTVGLLYIISFIFWEKGIDITKILNPNNNIFIRIVVLFFDFRVPMLLSVYLTGYLYKNHKSKININFKYFILCMLILFYFKDKAIIEISANKFEGPIMFYFISIVGIYVNLYIAKILNSRKQKVLNYIGENSMYIMVFHFLAFKIVNYMQIVIYKLPIERLSEFPGLKYSSYNNWWIIYTMIGVFIPLGIKIIIDFFKNTINNFLSNEVLKE